MKTVEDLGYKKQDTIIIDRYGINCDSVIIEHKYNRTNSIDSWAYYGNSIHEVIPEFTSEKELIAYLEDKGKIRITLAELKKVKNWKKAVIVFSKDSFKEEHTEKERSYTISSDAKYFDSSKIGNSLFGDCIDGNDNGVRLDFYIHAEGKWRWKIDYCYLI